MTILEDIKNIRSEKKQLREFGWVVGGVLLLIAAWLCYKDKNAWAYLATIGGALVVLGFVLPKVLLPLQKVWMAFAVVMGFIMSRLILFLLYYVVFTLTGLLTRLLGKDLLNRKLDRSATSYWNIRDKEKIDKKRYEMQY